jgi:hypothetical protein
LERVEQWLEENGYEAYADYRDEIPMEAARAAVKGDMEKFDEAIYEIESHFRDYIEYEFHMDNCIRDLKLAPEVKEDEEFVDAFHEGTWIDMGDWIKTAARNTRLHITATPYTGEPLKEGQRLFEEDQDERLFLFPHEYCSDEENERRRQKLADVLGITPDGDSNMYEFDELKVLGTLSLGDVIEQGGPPTHITISPDMPNEMLAHNSVNGSGGMGELKATKTATLPAMFEVDNDNRYGVDAVYGFVGEVWAKELPASRLEPVA